MDNKEEQLSMFPKVLDIISGIESVSIIRITTIIKSFQIEHYNYKYYLNIDVVILNIRIKCFRIINSK